MPAAAGKSRAELFAYKSDHLARFLFEFLRESCLEPEEENPGKGGGVQRDKCLRILPVCLSGEFQILSDRVTD